MRKMVKLNQKMNLAACFAVILFTAVALFVLESVEIFKLKTPEIHNDIALAALESCNKTDEGCECKTLQECSECPLEYPTPPECHVTGHREFVRCTPGDHEFYKQCREGELDARRNGFWTFYLSSGVVLIGSVLSVSLRKHFLENCSSDRLDDF